MKNPLVTVIVTTKNSEKTLETCLKSVQNQTYKNVELIVIDNFSTDKTIIIANKYTSHIFKKGPERSSQRNIGIQKSKGEFLLFLDSDMSLSSRVIEECINTISNSNISGIYIPEIIAGNSFWSKIRTFERSFYNETVIDAVRFVQKSIVEKTKGFDETLFAGEDWDFDLRFKTFGKTGSISEPLFHHEEDSNIHSYLSKKNYYTDNLLVYKNKWKQDQDVQKQFSPFYRFIGVFIENGKWKKIIMHPVLFFCVIMLKFSVGLQFVLQNNIKIVTTHDK